MCRLCRARYAKPENQTDDRCRVGGSLDEFAPPIWGVRHRSGDEFTICSEFPRSVCSVRRGAGVKTKIELTIPGYKDSLYRPDKVEDAYLKVTRVNGITEFQVGESCVKIPHGDLLELKRLLDDIT